MARKVNNLSSSMRAYSCFISKTVPLIGVVGSNCMSDNFKQQEHLGVACCLLRDVFGALHRPRMGLLEVRDQRVTRFQETRSRMTALTTRSFVFHSLMRIGVHVQRLPFDQRENPSQPASRVGETSAPFWPVVLLHIEDEVRGLAGFGQ